MSIVMLSPAQRRAALPLFADKPTHEVARSGCLGLIDCRIFVDDADRPQSAVLVLERFGIGFAAGDVVHAQALLARLHGWHPWYEIADPPESWHPVLAAWSKESHAFSRYAVVNDPAAFDREALGRMARPPVGKTISRYNGALLAQALSAPWSEDQTGGFPTSEAFLRDGYGVALLDGDTLVAGCASFCRHQNGFEIQVDTHPDYRGRGLATCVSAAFILDVLEMGMIPYWDAANIHSMRLAQRLGYAFWHAYTAWMLISGASSQAEVAEKVIGVHVIGSSNGKERS